ncbi:MAG: hypothetical protein QXQ79_01405 [Candidatus Nanoarchaeia archaeon]
MEIKNLEAYLNELKSKYNGEEKEIYEINGYNEAAKDILFGLQEYDNFLEEWELKRCVEFLVYLGELFKDAETYIVIEHSKMYKNLPDKGLWGCYIFNDRQNPTEVLLVYGLMPLERNANHLTNRLTIIELYSK